MGKKFPFLSKKSHSRLEARDQKTKILDLVSKLETESKKFSISSQELKKASHYALPSPCWTEIILGFKHVMIFCYYVFGKGAEKNQKKYINDGFMYVCVAKKCEMMDFYFVFFLQ